MIKKRLLSMLVLLMAVVTGAWAQEPAKYSVTLAEGTEDATNWTVPTEAAAGTEVTVKYNGAKKVLGMKVEKKAEKKTSKSPSEVTAEDICKVIGQDGMIYDNKAAAEAAGTTAVAMIAYVGNESDCTHGLAIALSEEGKLMVYLGGADNAIATKNTNTPVTGCTWRLPSVSDWQHMLGSSKSAQMKTLWDSLAAAGAPADSDYYWTSTDIDGTVSYAISFMVTDEYEYWLEDAGKSYTYRVRAVLPF